ncbi:MAG: hypothetical protein R3F14_04110 [Polyangiaceae bacterium]
MNPRLLPRLGLSLAALLCAAMTGCLTDIDPGGDGGPAVPDDDPLAVPADIEPGTLDALQRDVIAKSCAAQPGLCHHGQFEPNLSTATLTYENLVLRPGIERDKQYRVTPGDPANSLLIDKLRNKDVLSQMPLGAKPLAEDDIAAIEQWIAGGALRRPGEDAAPKLNNPPAEPQIAVFDEAGNRLDAGGPFSVAAGTKLVLRHSVQDFETDDADIPYAAFILQLADGRSIQVSTTPGAETSAITSYDGPGAPEGIGDALNFAFEWTVPATLTLMDDAGNVTTEDAAGQSISSSPFTSTPSPPSKGILTFSFEPALVKVTP